jgi:hypothetical protein
VLVVPARRGPFRDHLVFFATARDVDRFTHQCGSRDVYRFRHASCDAATADALHVGDSTTTTVDLARPLDDIRHGFDPKSCRYEIRRAEKLGERLVVRRDDPQTVRDFVRLYDALVERRRFSPRMRRSRLRRYLRVGNLFMAYLDDTPIVGHVVVVDALAARVRLVFSASTRLEDGPHRALVGPANRWLHWQEMRQYRDTGITAYDFGGVSPTSPSARFKLSFGGRIDAGRNLVVAGRSAAGALALVGATSGDFRRRRAAARAAS